MNVKNTKFSRRDFLKLFRTATLTALASGLGGIIYSASMEPGWLDVVRLKMPLRRLPKSFTGFKIAQISDIHMGGWMTRARLSASVEKILAEKPDIVVITGDFLLGRGWDEIRETALQDVVDGLAPLVAGLPVYAVLGNHDYWTDANKIGIALSKAGLELMVNATGVLRRGADELYLAGLGDVYEHQHRLAVLLRKIPLDACSILLCHEPDYADYASLTDAFDLQLSGHSHGGQVVIPFIGPIKTPSLAHKYPLGQYQVGDMIQYTNRGLGMASIPIRFNCRPEITIFTLETQG